MAKESQNPITTPDWRAERLAAIKRLYPDLFTDEGKINPLEIGMLVDEGKVSLREKFEFRWPGKMHAKKAAFTSSKARLAPDMDRSVNFDETKNVIIEGENLEVLKLLSKAYYNKVKCIYIDPPYNTGHDFVYSDDYSEGKQAYWEKNGVFHDGLKVDTNSESAGRYHTNWLNMMMPRLLLAQMMLKDDGVIFVSIDDNEVHNLRKLMDEVFGEECFIGELTWESTTQPDNIGRARFGLQKNIEYILSYSRSVKSELPPFLLKKKTEAKKYPHQGKHGKCRFEIIERAFDGAYARPTMRFKILNQSPREGKQWQIGEEAARQLEAKEKIEIVDGIVKRAVYPEDELEDTGFDPFWAHLIDVGTSQKGKAELIEILGQSVGFETVKPTALLKKILSHFDSDALILDFFAGSGTTAQAILELNREDSGNRKFVLIQIPESLDETSTAYQAGYKKISEITVDRVKRVGERIHNEKPDVDVGFKVFKLTTSIFPENTYQPDPEKSAEENVLALKEHIARAKQQLMFDPKGKETDLMYETLIKQGFMLTMAKERLKEFGENEVWKVTDGDRSAVVCLDAELKDATVKALARFKDNRFIGLHRAVDTTKKWELTQTFGETLVLI